MKTMKTKWAKAGSMFLAVAAVLSSCSNEEVIPGERLLWGKEMLSRQVFRSLFLRRYPVLPATMFKATTISWV